MGSAGEDNEGKGAVVVETDEDDGNADNAFDGSDVKNEEAERIFVNADSEAVTLLKTVVGDIIKNDAKDVAVGVTVGEKLGNALIETPFVDDNVIRVVVEVAPGLYAN